MVDDMNTPVEDLIRSQLQSEDQAVYSHKFQITVEKDLPQAMTCRLAQLSSSFTWLKKKCTMLDKLSKLWLFNHKRADFLSSKFLIFFFTSQPP